MHPYAILKAPENLESIFSQIFRIKNSVYVFQINPICLYAKNAHKILLFEVRFACYRTQGWAIVVGGPVPEGFGWFSGGKVVEMLVLVARIIDLPAGVLIFMYMRRLYV